MADKAMRTRHVIMNYFGPRWRKGCFVPYENVFSRRSRSSFESRCTSAGTKTDGLVYIRGKTVRQEKKNKREKRRIFNSSPGIIGETDTFTCVPVCSFRTMRYVSRRWWNTTFHRQKIPCRFVRYFFIIASLFDTRNLILFFLRSSS